MKKITILTLIIALAFISCDTFFSDSMGSSRDYNSRNIHLTTRNIGEWAQATVGNPPLARAVMRSLQRRLNTATPTEMAIFLSYASMIAMEGSGVGASLLINSTDLLGEFVSDASPQELVDNMTEIIERLLRDIDGRGGSDASRTFANTVGLGINTENGIPTFNQAYIDSIQPSDLNDALLVLILGELMDNDDYNVDNLGNFDALGLRTVIEPTDSGGLRSSVRVMDDRDPGPNAIAMAAYLNIIHHDTTGRFDNNPLTSALSNTLGSNSEEDIQ